MGLKENANSRACEVIRVSRCESEFFSSRNNSQKCESEIYLRELAWFFLTVKFISVYFELFYVQFVYHL